MPYSPFAQKGLEALADSSNPPHTIPKSLSAKDTDANAKATPPLNPENHIINIYTDEILGRVVEPGSSDRMQFVNHEPM